MKSESSLARCVTLGVHTVCAAALLAPIASSADGGTLVWARYDDIDSLDPHRATSTLSMQVWDQIYETLLSFDEAGNVQPHIAKSWSVSDDGLEYTLSLQEGVTCHDGNALRRERRQVHDRSRLQSRHREPHQDRVGTHRIRLRARSADGEGQDVQPVRGVHSVSCGQLLQHRLRFRCQHGRRFRFERRRRRRPVQAREVGQGRRGRDGEECELQELRPTRREHGRSAHRSARGQDRPGIADPPRGATNRRGARRRAAVRRHPGNQGEGRPEHHRGQQYRPERVLGVHHQPAAVQ